MIQLLSGINMTGTQDEYIGIDLNAVHFPTTRCCQILHAGPLDVRFIVLIFFQALSRKQTANHKLTNSDAKRLFCDVKCSYVIPLWFSTKTCRAQLSFAGQWGHLRTATPHLSCARTSVISLARLTFKPRVAAMARHEMRSWLCSFLRVIRPFWEIRPFFLACFRLHNPPLDNYRSPFFTNEVKTEHSLRF